MEPEKNGLEILQHFIFNETEHKVHIVWINGKPWFRASDIGDILDIKEVRSVIRNFDLDEKGVHIMHSLGGPQNLLHFFFKSFERFTVF